MRFLEKFALFSFIYFCHDLIGFIIGVVPPNVVAAANAKVSSSLSNQTNPIENKVLDDGIVTPANGSINDEEQLSNSGSATIRQSPPRKTPIRILYTITTLAEDRLQQTLIPVAQEGSHSMVKAGYYVDVYIIAYYTMTQEEKDDVRSAISKVSRGNVTIWDDAAPYAYIKGLGRPSNALKVGILQNYDVGLSRQHRYVVKDRLMDYDLFLNFEDDMIIQSDTIDYYLEMTQTLFKLRENAPDTVPAKQLDSFYGMLTKSQLERIIPGLIRVEVLLTDPRDLTVTEEAAKVFPQNRHHGTRKHIKKHSFTKGVPDTRHSGINATSCCHLSKYSSSVLRPPKPMSKLLFQWETQVVALGVRHMPTLGWVALQRGPNKKDKASTLHDFWTGTNGYFHKGGGRLEPKQARPPSNNPRYINNQGGWMGTRQQIWEWHTKICQGGFLPPYDAPHYNKDGLDNRNVEYWSGGMHLVTENHGCNLQRIISLDNPQGFARQLIYHSSNNKQSGRKLNDFVSINDFYGQLLTVRNDAHEVMKRQQGDANEQ